MHFMGIFKSKGVLGEPNAAGIREVRDLRTGERSLGSAPLGWEKSLREGLTVDGKHDQIKPALRNLLFVKSLDELVSLFPDPVQQIEFTDALGSIFREALTDALLIAERPHPSEKSEVFKEHLLIIERIVRQLGSLSSTDRAELISVLHTSHLIELIQLQLKADEHERLLTDSQKTMLLPEAVKQAKLLEKGILKTVEDDRSPFEVDVLAFLKSIRDGKGIPAALKMLATGAGEK